jgi:hypothetical protein
VEQGLLISGRGKARGEEEGGARVGEGEKTKIVHSYLSISNWILEIKGKK